MATQVGSLYTSLTLDSASFQSNMKRAATAAEQGSAQITKALSAAKTAAIGFATAFAVDQFLGLARGATDFASSLGETAQQLGYSTKSLQELRYAATQSGASIEQADAALGKFSINVGKARDGNDKLRAAFAAVGVSVSDLASLDTAQLFAEVADGISKIPDPARRAAAEVALLGKGGQALGAVLNSGRAGLEAFSEQAERLGIVVSDKAINALDELNDSGDRLKLTFNAQLANLIGENAGAITAVGNEAAAAVGKLAAFLNEMRGVTALIQRGDFAGLITNSSEQLQKIGSAKGRAAYDQAKVAELEKRAASISGKVEIAFGRNLTTQLADARKASAESTAALLNDQFAITAYLPKAKAPVNNFAISGGGLTSKKSRSSSGSSRSSSSGGDKYSLADLAIDPRDPINLDVDRADVAAASMRDARDFADGFAGSLDLVDTDILPGVRDGLAQLADEAERAQQASNNFANDLASGLADAIVNGKNLGDVLVSSLKRAAAEAIGSGIFKLLTGGGGGGGVGGIFSKIFGGGFAEGGSPPANKISVVGERGPELFVPKSSGGMILPNGVLGGLGGQQRVGVDVNISPSPLFIAAVASTTQQAANQAAQKTIDQRSRRPIPRSRSA